MDRGADLGDDSNAFVPEPLVGVTVVLIRSANTAVGNLDNDLGRPRVTVAFGFDDISGFGAFEDCKIDAHDRKGNRTKLRRWK